MDIKTILLYLFIVAPVGATILLLVVAWYKLIRKPRQQNGQQTSLAPTASREWIKKKWNAWKNFLLLFAGIFSIHLIVWMMFPEFWVRWWSQPWFMLYQIILGLGFYLCTQKGYLSKIGIILCALGLFAVGRSLYHTISGDEGITIVKETIRPTRYATPLPSNWHPTLLRPKEAEGKDTEAVRKFWDGHPHPNITVEEMVIICRNESGCNQRNDDGTVVRNHNQNGAKDDVGVMQINEGWWAKEVIQQKALDIDLTQMDITTIEGNLQAALHLRTRYGLAPWTQRKFRESWIVEAPVGKWGDVVITPQDRSMTCRPDPDTSVKVLVNGEWEEIYVPGTPLNLGGGIITKRFQSPDKKTVTILCSLE